MQLMLPFCNRLDTQADPTTAAAVAAVQADVDANETAAATARTNPADSSPG